jgi:hypothetical protein
MAGGRGVWGGRGREGEGRGWGGRGGFSWTNCMLYKAKASWCGGGGNKSSRPCRGEGGWSTKLSRLCELAAGLQDYFVEIHRKTHTSLCCVRIR